MVLERAISRAECLQGARPSLVHEVLQVDEFSVMLADDFVLPHCQKEFWEDISKGLQLI